jgi:hypothetical protein
VPIKPYLAGQAFDPESIKHMSDVLEKVCGELGINLRDGHKDPAADIIAEKVIERARKGVHTPTALYLSVIAEFQAPDQKPN